MQAIEYADKKSFIRKDCLEELSHLCYFSFFSERWVEENIFDEIYKLDLHDILFIENDLVQHLEEILRNVVN